MLGRASRPVQPVQTKQLSRGKVTERPWGLTLAALAAGSHTGVVTITAAERKLYSLAFAGGVLVDAASPVSADSIARVALAKRLIPAAHAAEIAKRQARTPDADEVAVVAEVTRLGHDELDRLRRHAILQRAARTFAIESGAYRFEPGVEPPGASSVAVDLAAIIYQGARLHVADERMAIDLRMLGSYFVLKADALPMLARFGFPDTVGPILRLLEHGTSLAELEAKHRDLDPRTTRATIYALACCDAIVRAENERAARAVAPVVSRTQTTVTGTPAPAGAEGSARILVPTEIATMIVDRCALIDAGRDLFAVLALEHGASIEAVRSAYLELVAYVDPDRLAGFGIEESPDSRRLYARATMAYETLTDPSRRAAYLQQQAAAPAQRASDAVGEGEQATRARNAAVRGSRLLEANRPAAAVAELAKACELDPADVDYRALYAWATFCAAPHKQTVEAATRRTLVRALDGTRRPELIRIYLGRMERMVGHDLEALQHFREALVLAPGLTEAATEIRVIEARLARGTKRLR